jgi:hypothetical protein
MGVLAAGQRAVSSMQREHQFKAYGPGSRHVAGLRHRYKLMVKSWLLVPSQRAGQAAGYSLNPVMK